MWPRLPVRQLSGINWFWKLVHLTGRAVRRRSLHDIQQNKPTSEQSGSHLISLSQNIKAKSLAPPTLLSLTTAESISIFCSFPDRLADATHERTGVNSSLFSALNEDFSGVCRGGGPMGKINCEEGTKSNERRTQATQ